MSIISNSDISHKITTTRKAFSLVEISIVILIVGILIAGISKGADLYQDYKFTVARKLTLNSRVGRIPDLNLWLETTSSQSLQNNNNSYSLSDGDTIKNWNDINPVGVQKFIASQSNSGLQPTYRKNGIGGLPTLFFDANSAATTGKSLQIPYSADLNTSTFTIFLVAQPIEATTNYGAIIMSRNATFPRNGYNIYKNSTNTSYEFWVGASNGNWYAASAPLFQLSKSVIITALCDSANQIIYINSILKDSKAYPFDLNRSYSFSIGREYSGTFSYDGNISEIIYYGRNLSDNERILVENYLMQKYQIKN